MNNYPSGKIRNVVLLGHSGSGKTTLAETMLYESGMMRKRGSVENRNTVSDFRDIEKEKEKSVFGSLMHLDWRGTKVNLFDTPGTPDFWGQISDSLHVADSAMVLLNSEAGVEVGTEAYWKAAEEKNMPTMLVVNKLDSEYSNFQKTVDMAKERFGRGVAVVQYPYSEGEDFHAIIDVLKMTMYEFPEDGGKPDKLPIPDSQRAQAELLHNELVEAVAENDETLLDLYFENGELDEYQMRDGLKLSMDNRDIFPLFCTCAQRNMGSGRVMGFICNVTPDPLQRELSLADGGTHRISPEKPPSMFVFRTSSEAHVGDLTFFKATGGEIVHGSEMINQRTGDSIRIGSLYMDQGEKRMEVNSVSAGDIAVAVKLKDVNSGDTLAEKGTELEFAPVEYPDTTIRVALKVTNEGEEDKLANALHQIEKEDPSVKVEQSQELQQTILHGLGEEHLGVIHHQLKERFKLDVEFVTPKIPYRETITKKVDAHYKHKKQSGGAGQYAEVYLSIEPWYEGMPERSDLNVRGVQEIDLEWGGKLVFQNCIVGGVIDNRFLPAILKGVMEKMANGPMSGCRARDIRVSVYDGSMHSVDSNEAAFKTAGLMAFKEGFLNASPQLLEPTYEIEVTLPADYMGDVLSDLSSRRGQIQGMDSEGSIQKIKAQVPLQELDHYTTRLKSMTQGSATYTRAFHSYTQVPHDVQKRVMEETLETADA
ncbi:elongation factor G [Rhodohalobacter mucosus]|uniref:Elongation factor G n=1 Tax=Rhodohalobacter mucosus TaxID=2079485 RepID=A0A316TVP1_9BACT|nr:elongation factor G [Rhodohalobacter mucosus]PWN07205.1 elongation factor G [Rhodohalobacter mucosus]